MTITPAFLAPILSQPPATATRYRWGGPYRGLNSSSTMPASEITKLRTTDMIGGVQWKGPNIVRVHLPTFTWTHTHNGTVTTWRALAGSSTNGWPGPPPGSGAAGNRVWVPTITAQDEDLMLAFLADMKALGISVVLDPHTGPGQGLWERDPDTGNPHWKPEPYTMRSACHFWFWPEYREAWIEGARVVGRITKNVGSELAGYTFGNEITQPQRYWNDATNPPQLMQRGKRSVANGGGSSRQFPLLFSGDNDDQPIAIYNTPDAPHVFAPNEPDTRCWASTQQAMADAFREADKRHTIIATQNGRGADGYGGWIMWTSNYYDSQGVDIGCLVNDPLGGDNVVYDLHFYYPNGGWTQGKAVDYDTSASGVNLVREVYPGTMNRTETWERNAFTSTGALNPNNQMYLKLKQAIDWQAAHSLETMYVSEFGPKGTYYENNQTPTGGAHLFDQDLTEIFEHLGWSYGVHTLATSNNGNYNSWDWRANPDQYLVIRGRYELNTFAA